MIHNRTWKGLFESTRSPAGPVPLETERVKCAVTMHWQQVGLLNPWIHAAYMYFSSTASASYEGCDGPGGHFPSFSIIFMWIDVSSGRKLVLLGFCPFRPFPARANLMDGFAGQMYSLILACHYYFKLLIKPRWFWWVLFSLCQILLSVNKTVKLSSFQWKRETFRRMFLFNTLNKLRNAANWPLVSEGGGETRLCKYNANCRLLTDSFQLEKYDISPNPTGDLNKHLAVLRVKYLLV